MTSTVRTAHDTGVASTALYPIQVCFVVDDVTTAVAECVSCFGWGPFYQFCASVEEAEYRGRHGLVHAAGTVCGRSPPPDATLECAWLEDDEAFALYDWAGGARTLQLRDVEC